MAEESATIGWAIVEVMGHSVYAGHVSERAIGGGSFIQVDVPAVEDCPAFTKLLGHGSIFAITPTDEETCRRAARGHRARPLNIYIAPVEKRIEQMQGAMFDGDIDDEDGLIHG